MSCAVAWSATTRPSLAAPVLDQTYARMTDDLPRRRRLRALAADWLERVHGDALESAWHHHRVGDNAQAVDVLTGYTSDHRPGVPTRHRVRGRGRGRRRRVYRFHRPQFRLAVMTGCSRMSGTTT